MCVPPIPQATIRLLENSGRYLLLVLAWLAQYVAPAPYRFDVVLAVRRAGELLAQLADEDVDDLDLRLVQATVELGEEHFLGDRRALAQAQELQHLVLLAGKVHANLVDLDRLGVELNDEFAGLDDRLCMALGEAHDGV